MAMQTAAFIRFEIAGDITPWTQLARSHHLPSSTGGVAVRGGTPSPNTRPMLTQRISGLDRPKAAAVQRSGGKVSESLD
jgi:hypothetical protein